MNHCPCLLSELQFCIPGIVLRPMQHELQQQGSMVFVWHEEKIMNSIQNNRINGAEKMSEGLLLASLRDNFQVLQ